MEETKKIKTEEYKLLRKLWPDNKKETKKIVKLVYAETDQKIIDRKRPDVIVEIVEMLRTTPFREVYKYLKRSTSPEDLIWGQPSMDAGREAVQREIAIQQTKDVGIKGVGRCRFCASTELVFATKQTRSGDEAATIFVRCVMCDKQWRQ